MLSASIDTAREVAPLADAAKGDAVCCGFCAQPGATFPARVRGPAGETIRGCALCFLAEHLDRPRIDEEASLIWLPEVSQVVINTLMREIHIRLRTLGETLHAEFRLSLDTEERRRLFHARALLQSRGAAAVARLGTGRPSELAERDAAAFRRGLSAAIQAARRVAPAAVGTLLRGRSGYLSRDRRSLARGHRRRRGARAWQVQADVRLAREWPGQPIAAAEAAFDRLLRSGDGARRRADHQAAAITSPGSASTACSGWPSARISAQITEAMRLDLSGALETRGHAIVGWYISDPDAALVEIERLNLSVLPVDRARGRPRSARHSR